MRVWRSIELERLGPGRWRLQWHRRSTRTGAHERLVVEGPLRAIAWLLPRALPILNRSWR